MLMPAAGLHTRAGIGESGVLDVHDRRLIVHREPKRGYYGFDVRYSEHENPAAAPARAIRVANAFVRIGVS